MTPEPIPAAPSLTDDEKRTLLVLARRAIGAFLSGAALDIPPEARTGGLLVRRCAFVTLHDAREDLRGCIGTLEARQPLAETVREHAIHAAFHDPRFAPVSAAELESLVIEISALHPGELPGTPFISVASPGEIVLGRDGLYLVHRAGGRGGVLLPQVPVEQHWDLETFLAALCRKAGLPPGSWESPACRLYRFSAEVFSEREFPRS